MFRPFRYSTEDEIESILIQGSCFGQYWFFDFKRDLASDLDSFPIRVHPDLIAVAKDFSHWCIVEVELSRHDVKGHIWPQLLMLKSVIDSLSIDNRCRILSEILDDENLVQRLANDRPFLFLVFDRSSLNLRDLTNFALSFSSVLYMNPFYDEFNKFLYMEEILYEDSLKFGYSLCVTQQSRLYLFNPSLVDVRLNTRNEIDVLLEKSGTSSVPLKLIILNSLVVVHGLKKGFYKLYNQNETLKLIKYEI